MVMVLPIVRAVTAFGDYSGAALQFMWQDWVGVCCLPYQTRHLKSLDDLRAHSAAWDRLWLRSDVTIPTPQAALLEQWLVQFDAAAKFEAIVIEQDGKLLAALPLIKSRLRGLLPAATMPSNHWTPAGDLLVDPEATDEVFDLLADAISASSWSLLWLDFAIIDAVRWLRLVDACKRQGLAVDVHPHFRLPRIDIVGTWEAYRSSWSRNHRQSLARARRKLIAEYGEPRLNILQPTDNHEIDELLAQGFAIEDRSWKGAAGSSVARSPRMLDYFTAQARLLAQRNQLEVAFWAVADRPIAFMYGWNAKGIFHAFKAGYDEAFASFSPGQQIIQDMLESFFRTGSHRMFDCVGPVTPATARWQTSDYEAGRIVIAPRRMLGQAAYFAYKHLAPTLRYWRQVAKTGLARGSIHDRQDVALAQDE